MSQTVPPQMLGQEDGPNPLEIFYEKNKRWLYAAAALVVVALGVKYGMEELERTKRDRAWSDFTSSTGLAIEFSKKADLPAGRNLEQYWGYFLQSHMDKQVSAMQHDLLSTDKAQLTKKIADAKGTPQEPWLVWVAANRAYSAADFAGARNLLNDLKTRFANHVLCQRTSHPPQVLAEKEDPDKKKKKDKKEATTKKDKPKLEDAKAGSMVDNLLAAIAKDEAFRSSQSGFFKAEQPAAGDSVVIKFADVGEVEITLFPSAAKAHVEAFTKNFLGGLYKGMRVHKIKRNSKGSPNDSAPHLVYLGNPKSKDQDRSKWLEEVKSKDEDVLPFEENRLSFFPGMVAAEQEKEGKSSGKRFFIAVTDGAATLDGEYVIFGKVTRGMEVLQDIVSGDMLDESEAKRGEGRPAREVLVESCTLVPKR
ncbi:MAG: peptidylprolyl isomerase [Planctomycetes bacterium]|nr:peptidylprolyl isomerase [Planctomycetota bacterium]